MTETEIIAEIRRLIRETSPVNVANTDISAVIRRGVAMLGGIIKEAAPSYHTRKAVLSSNSHVFNSPSDCMSVRNIWDANGNATAITQATNSDPIQVTAASHGLSDGDVVIVSGVLGNTAANGIWATGSVDDDNVTLTGSEGNGDWTSGGYIIKVDRDLTRITRVAPGNATLTNRYGWYPQRNKIVVDYLDMENDIIIEYGYRPTEVTDIPEEYHDGLISYGVIRLMRMPEPKSPAFSDKRKVLDEQSMVLNEIKENIKAFMQPATESEPIEDEINWNSLWED
jgi:hypothetical protein